jgi:enoyl-CoA hydratase/carnithine racemase
LKDRVEVSINNHVAEVMLNRPDKFNALDLGMFRGLDEAARMLTAERSVRAVVLHGAGANFCAGIDISALQGATESVAALLSPTDNSPANLAQRAAYAWRELPVPVICATQGIIYGGGFQIAMGADLRYAAPNSQFSIMESKWGLIPDMAISTTLRNIVPADRVKELAWTGRVFDAAEALQLGIVTAVESDPLEAARERANTCAGKSPDAIRGIKRLVNEAWGEGDEISLALEAQVQTGLLGKANQVEAVRANLENRKPKFVD